MDIIIILMIINKNYFMIINYFAAIMSEYDDIYFQMESHLPRRNPYERLITRIMIKSNTGKK